MGRYLVTGHRRVEGVDPGEELVFDFDEETERAYVQRGALEILPSSYTVIAPGAIVAGHVYGETFEHAFTVGEVAALLGSHIEVAGAEELPPKSASRAEWDAVAEKHGLNPADFANKEDLIEAVVGEDAGEGKEE